MCMALVELVGCALVRGGPTAMRFLEGSFGSRVVKDDIDHVDDLDDGHVTTLLGMMATMRMMMWMMTCTRRLVKP